MGIAELLAAYLAGRITEETFKRLMVLAESSETTSDIRDCLEDTVDDIKDFFDFY